MSALGRADHGSGIDDELRKCRVLVVEDTEASRRLIGAFLAAAGIREVAFAIDGVDGLEKAESFDPDLVILDIMMPRMDGFEVCRRLRANPRFRRLPILVQTALGAPEERTSVFRAGATDLVTKPIHGPELIARVRVHLENRMLVRNLEDFRERVESELNLAREMQAQLLPSAELTATLSDKYGLLLQAHFETSSELGGDYWGVRALDDHRVAVFIVDFAGHGVTAALNTFRLHTLIRQLPPEGHGPAEYLGMLNDRMVELLATDQYCTFLYGVLDTETDLFTYAAAAAPAPIQGTSSGAAMIDSSGLPVGIARGIPYEERVIPFPRGHFLLLYSDALTETEDTSGRVLEEEDVTALAMLATDQPDPLAHILENFRRDRPVVGDDLTVVWFQRT
jgi:sigma-B regulation protein RsbU (phosphoserine phosphatase)